MMNRLWLGLLALVCAGCFTIEGNPSREYRNDPLYALGVPFQTTNGLGQTRLVPGSAMRAHAARHGY